MSCGLARAMRASLALTLVAVCVFAGCKSKAGSELASVRAALEQEPAVDVAMFALRVGRSPSAPRKYFIADPELPERIPVSFWFWALEFDERVILIDCGFVSQDRARRWGIADWISPAVLVERAGLSPSAVTDVIVTHGHWDHVGGLGMFPAARVWIDPRALAAATGEAHKAEPALAKVLTGLAGQERLHELERVRAVAPGVVVFPTGLHAPGAWAVAVRSADGVWVFASDEVPLYRNLTRRIPSGQTSDPGRSRALFAAMLGLVGNHTERIIPGHEDRLAERFHRVDDRVVRIGKWP